MKPMLAGKVDDVYKLRYPLIASPKVDGVRALVVDGKVMSRAMKPIPNKHVQKCFWDFEGADGELFVGDITSPTCYVDTVSAVMTEEGEPDVTFTVFDNWKNPLLYCQRLDSVLNFSCAHLNQLEYYFIDTPEDLLHYEDQCVRYGYEGVMVRDPSGPYKQGRSTLKEQYLLKIKRFDDSEAIVVDIVELMRNKNEAKINELGYTTRSSHKENLIESGMLGAFVVEDVATKQQFKIGTGFTEEQRKQFFSVDSIGKIVKYKHQPSGKKDLPRFPSFLGFRSVLDG